jgi:hypothetical protein
MALCEILFNRVTLTWQTRTEVKADSTALQQYVGVYAFDKSQFSVTFRKGRFEIEGVLHSDLPKLTLHAESRNKFFLEEVDLQFEFITDKNNKVTQLLFHQNGHSTVWKKIK